MDRFRFKRWILTLIAGGGVAVAAPAQAEVFYSGVDLAQQLELGTMGDRLMHKQLCAHSAVEGSCLDGGRTAKWRLLFPQPPHDDPVVPEPPGDGRLPPVIEELPPVSETAPLAPISEVPNRVAVPEPGGLSLAALFLAALVASLPKRRHRSRGRYVPGSV